MILIFGLGNPGKQYELTRHNLGKRAVVYFVKKVSGGSDWQTKPPLRSVIYKTRLHEKEVIFAHSLEFMNNSGLSVKQLANYYKIPSQQVIIVHDDVDIALGKLKIAENKKAAGHNGVLSVQRHLGTRDFVRFRLGVWNWRRFPQKNKEITERIILKPFLEEEQAVISRALNKLTNDLDAYIKNHFPCPT